ncbi:MAG: hypothetical protein ACAH95_06750, partial [Fimbriimonas sp.]
MLAKRPLLGMLPMLFASIALAQGVFRYTDQAGSLTVTGKSARFTQLDGPVYKFTLTGSVVIDDKVQGLKMASKQVTLDAVPTKADAKKSEIRKAIATGGVDITKAVTTPQGSRVTRMVGSRGDYTNRTVDGLINLTGPVTLTNLDRAKNQNLVATGNSLVAVLEPKTTAKRNGLRSATLSGSAR